MCDQREQQVERFRADADLGTAPCQLAPLGVGREVVEARDHRLGITAAVIVSLCAIAGDILGQGFQTGRLNGNVVDASGTPLSAISVRVTHMEKGFSRASATSANGEVTFAALPVGRYTVTAETGAREAAMSDVAVEADRTTFITLPVLAAVTEEITVGAGERPLVDPTNVAAQMRITVSEIVPVPVEGRSFITIVTFAPGVTGLNVHGALTSESSFRVDGIEIGDPVTGLPSSNLNFEAIEDVAVYTAGLPAEYGWAAGGVVNVITRSGSNDFHGSVQALTTNDAWNAQNRSQHGVTGASLARKRFDQVNPVWVATLGGPIRRDRAWFFASLETSTLTSDRRQTAAVSEEFQERRKTTLGLVRLTSVIAPKHTVWLRYATDPISGLIVDTFGTAGPTELEALTRSERDARQITAQYTGLVGNNAIIEAMAARAESETRLRPFETSTLTGGAPHLSLADGRFYNGGGSVGTINRPRTQAAAAVSLLENGRHGFHDIKAGGEWQRVESMTDLAFPGDQLYVDRAFDAVARTFLPAQRRDYVTGASSSSGNLFALYVRDRFNPSSRLALDAGARLEMQRSSNDAGESTVDARRISPRLSMSYSFRADGKALAAITAGRYAEPLLQNFSDAFARLPPREIYDLYLWNGTSYVFSRRQAAAGASFKPNADVRLPYIDELTLGFQHQFGAGVAYGARVVAREWGDLVDDIHRFNSDGTITRTVVNHPDAKRAYRGFELTFEKRWSRRWHALANYTWGRTSGNHFSRGFTSLGDHEDAMCRSTIDRSIGAGGVVPCADVNSPERLSGHPDYDRTQNLKLGASHQRDIGRATLSVGGVAYALGGMHFSKTRTLNVLTPGTAGDAGPTHTWYYEGAGSDRGRTLAQLDLSSEVAAPVAGVTVAIRGEVFNVTDRQAAIVANNVAWCGDPNGSAACLSARDTFGASTTRTAFQSPRSFRLTALVRF